MLTSSLAGGMREPGKPSQGRPTDMVPGVEEQNVLAYTTRKVAKELLRSNRKPRNRSEQMIVNSYRTISLLRERVDRPLSIDLLNEIVYRTFYSIIPRHSRAKSVEWSFLVPRKSSRQSRGSGGTAAPMLTPAHLSNRKLQPSADRAGSSTTRRPAGPRWGAQVNQKVIHPHSGQIPVDGPGRSRVQREYLLLRRLNPRHLG